MRCCLFSKSLPPTQVRPLRLCKRRYYNSYTFPGTDLQFLLPPWQKRWCLRFPDGFLTQGSMHSYRCRWRRSLLHLNILFLCHIALMHLMWFCRKSENCASRCRRVSPLHLPLFECRRRRLIQTERYFFRQANYEGPYSKQRLFRKQIPNYCPPE